MKFISLLIILTATSTTVTTGFASSFNDALKVKSKGTGISTSTSTTIGTSTATATRICAAPVCNRGLPRFDRNASAGDYVEDCIDDPSKTNPRVLDNANCGDCRLDSIPGQDRCI